jgi:hypothetical protein
MIKQEFPREVKAFFPLIAYKSISQENTAKRAPGSTVFLVLQVYLLPRERG